MLKAIEKIQLFSIKVERQHKDRASALFCLVNQIQAHIIEIDKKLNELVEAYNKSIGFDGGKNDSV